MSPMQSGSKFTDRITKYLTKSAERKTTRASKSKGHVISPLDFTLKQTKLLDFGLLQARRVIALCWKNMDAPSLKIWKKEILNSIGLERLTYIAKGKWKDFDQLWEPYCHDLGGGCLGFVVLEHMAFCFDSLPCVPLSSWCRLRPSCYPVC